MTTHQTSYGLSYILITPKDWEWLKPIAVGECGWTDYDVAQVECIQIPNCGYGILDAKYQRPIDNEYDLDEIYTEISEVGTEFAE